MVSEAMRDQNHRVRACEIAAALRLEGCAPAALSLLEHDGNRQVRGSAADLLRHFRNTAALPVVVRRMLAHREDFLTGATTLRNWGDRPGVESLRVHLGSEDASRRAAACLAVVQYGGKALAPRLIELVGQDEALVAGAALHALASLDPGAAARAEALALSRPDSDEVGTERQRWVAYRRI